MNQSNGLKVKNLKPMRKSPEQEVLDKVYPCTAANYFKVDNTSFHYKAAQNASNEIVKLITLQLLIKIWKRKIMSLFANKLSHE